MNIPRLTVRLVACATLFTGSAASAQVPQRTRDLLAADQPVTVVCFGDSITGVYYHTGGRRAYPEMLAIALKMTHPKAQIKVVNAGVSGHTTRDALARLERDVLKHRPQLVTVMFGMNDLVRVPLDEFKKNLVEIKDRCEKAGAEVLLCTQNNVIETGSRPKKKLAEITNLIRELAREHKLPLADCHAAFEAVRTRDGDEWRFLLSEEIHPNMDGHKLLAETLADAVTGKKVSLATVGPPTSALPRTLQLLKTGQPIKVLAMPPYDKALPAALKTIYPRAKIEAMTWKTDGLTLPQLEASAKTVRAMKPDLVLIAIPADAAAPTPESWHRSYSWVLNYSLSFARQEWDVLAVPPSTTGPTDPKLDSLPRRLITAQDLPMITRTPDESDAPLQAVLERWLKEQGVGK